MNGHEQCQHINLEPGQEGIGVSCYCESEQEAGGEEGCLGEESVPHVEYFLVSFIV